MEKYLQKIRQKKAIVLIILLFSTYLFAQTPSVIQNIRIPLWAEIDAYPELKEAQDLKAEAYSYPIQKIKEIAPFLVNGMVYGWNFVYVPSDKERNVDEYLEITEIVSQKAVENYIEYVSPWLENDKLNCWCTYKRSEAEIQNYYLWNSIKNPKIHGRGYGELIDGFDGIKTAANDAVKNAVRDYYRNIIKNKPKEIRGSILMRDIPTIGVTSGRYVINLDFFLECGKIIEYTVY